MNNGWIKLHRKFLEWEWLEKHDTVVLFLILLLLANHEDGEWQGIKIKRGQLITGLDKLSQQAKMSVQTTRTCINHLISTGEITNKSTNKYRIITISNYEKYQVIEKPLTSKSTDKPTDKLTSNQQATNKQTNSKQEDKNNKELKNDKNTLSSATTTDEFYKILLSDKKKHIQIIGGYLKVKQIEIDNKDKCQSLIKRNLRPAQDLVGYTLVRIKEVMEWLENKADFKWTLETVGKYIDEDLKKINKSQEDEIQEILKGKL